VPAVGTWAWSVLPTTREMASARRFIRVCSSWKRKAQRQLASLKRKERHQDTGS